MTFAEIKVAVAAYMQRDASTFVVGGTDLLTLAINGARKWAERERNFEQNRVQCQLAISLTDGTAMSGMVLLDGTTPVSIKSLIKGFLPILDATNAWFPIDVISREKHLERVARHYETVTNITNVSKRYPEMVAFFSVVRLADTLYLTPNDATVFNNADPVTVRFDAYKWLPDYTGTGTETDFLLTHAYDFMLLESVHKLNFYLKDDQRVPVSQAVLESQWHSVIAWDSNLVAADAADAMLD